MKNKLETRQSLSNAHLIKWKYFREKKSKFVKTNMYHEHEFFEAALN